MTDPAVNRKLGRMSRFEVIDLRESQKDNTRVFQALGARIQLAFRDGGQTLKVFVSDDGPESPLDRMAREGQEAGLYEATLGPPPRRHEPGFDEPVFDDRGG